MGGRRGWNQRNRSGCPSAQETRASVALLESGSSNPTLDVLLKISRGLKISIEELLASPRAECQLIKAIDVPVDRRSRNGVSLKKILPDKIPATEIDELLLEPDAILTGSPHTRTLASLRPKD